MEDGPAEQRELKVREYTPMLQQQMGVLQLNRAGHAAAAPPAAPPAAAAAPSHPMYLPAPSSAYPNFGDKQMKIVVS